MEEVFVSAKGLITFLLRFLLVPSLFLLSALITGLVKAIYWAWTRGRTNVVLLWVPPWRRRQFRDAFEASQKSQVLGHRAAEILPELLTGEMRGWVGALRRRRYRPPYEDKPLCPSTENTNHWLQQLLAHGASWMVFEQEYISEGRQTRFRVLEREDRGAQGTVSIGDVFGMRCELREPYDGTTYTPTVNVGDGLIVEIVEFRGRSALVKLAKAEDPGCVSRLGRPERRQFMVVASPWVYLELAPVKAHGTFVIRVEEIRLPGHKSLSRSLRVLHRLVVRNGQRLEPQLLFLVGLDEPPAAVCGPLPPDYPTYPELQWPRLLTVADASRAFCRTLRVLWRNRVTHARLWRQIRDPHVPVVPDCLLRLAVLEEPRRESGPKQFWAFQIGPSLLHFKGSSTRALVDLRVGAKTHVNARGGSYLWTDLWSRKEPTRVSNRTQRWWERHAAPSRWGRFCDSVCSWLLGYVDATCFDRHTRELEDYVFFLEQRTVGSSREICLLPVMPEGPPREALLSVRTEHLTDFQPGDAVRLFDARQIPSARGTVVRVQGRKVRISLKWSREYDNGTRFLMLDLDDIPARVQREAISQVRTDRSVNNYVSDNLRSCRSWLASFPVPSRMALSLWDSRLNENRSVLRALRVALRRSSRVALIQGPPGTGKTTFIVELVLQLILGRQQKVLLVSQGNLAVDEALERVARASNRVLAVRVGDRNKVAPSVRHLQYDWTDLDTRNGLRERLRAKGVTSMLRLWDPRAILNLAKDEAVSREEEAAERSEWERSAAHVDLVCATCVGIGTTRAYPFFDRTYDVVIVDEASRATQTEAIVPLRLGRRWVLVGDHRQLPPTVLPELRASLVSAGVDTAHASVSLFELLQGNEASQTRCGHLFRVPPQNRAMLATQYRMHPDIAQLVSEVFYGGSEGIKSAGDALGRGLPFSPFIAPICVVDTREWPRRGEHPFGQLPLNIEERSDRAETEKSLWNPLEVRLVVEVLKALAAASQATTPDVLAQINAKKGPDAGRITFAVITPYREQVYRLQEALGSVRKWGLLFPEEDSVATVDSYQGKERDIVIFTAVRTARSGKANLRFLEDLRRLNVAFSRARHKLILIGDGATLERADRDILNEHGKKVFERFLDAFFHGNKVRLVWSRPIDMAGGQPDQ